MTVVSVYRVYRERDRGWVQLDDGGMPKGPVRGRLEANPKPRRKHVKGGRRIRQRARDERSLRAEEVMGLSCDSPMCQAPSRRKIKRVRYSI